MTSHTKPHMLLWVDTETTGLDPDRCDLLEIACTITDMRPNSRSTSITPSSTPTTASPSPMRTT